MLLRLRLRCGHTHRTTTTLYHSLHLLLCEHGAHTSHCPPARLLLLCVLCLLLLRTGGRPRRVGLHGRCARRAWCCVRCACCRARVGPTGMVCIAA